MQSAFCHVTRANKVGSDCITPSSHAGLKSFSGGKSDAVQPFVKPLP